jgi:hypothetical protein
MEFLFLIFPPLRGALCLFPGSMKKCTVQVVSCSLGELSLRPQPREGEEHLFLKEFRLEWQTPVWVFEIDGYTLEKRIIMPYRQNTVYISYKLLRVTARCSYIFALLSFRRHDAPP